MIKNSAIRKNGLSISFITPTFSRDIERFALLRRSLAMFAPNIPHFVYVHTEDLPLFTKRFGQQPGLNLIPTVEVLPQKVEAERLKWQSFTGKIIDSLSWRLGLRQKDFSGWKLQQIVKLEALASSESDAVVFLDSDVILCSSFEFGQFVDAENKLRLRGTVAKNYEDFAFEVSRQILVGGDLMQPMAAFNYLHPGPSFLKRTGRVLIEHLRTIHADWHSTFFRQTFPSEFSLLGYAARELERYDGYQIDGSDPDQWGYNVKALAELWPSIDLCKAEFGRRKFLLVQSNLDMPFCDYYPPVDALLKSLA